MSDAIEPLAPVYRYFTADILTNKILMEIPFRGVSYELAIKAAGKFDGKIPAIPANKSLDLYNSTMPGQTALYVVRDGVCVWGGIIWSREIDTRDNDLRVSASEFTSYFFHRRIWKTWSHQYGAHVTISNGVAGVFFDYGTTSALTPGASVKLEFYEPRDFRYNGYYKISGAPSPTTNVFYIEGARSEVDIISVERTGNVVTLQSKSAHGFSTGDSITVALGSTGLYNGTYTISAPGGTETDRFTYTLNGPNANVTTVSGVATRPLPVGSFDQVTVSVRADTYDYVRSLVQAVFADFVGIDFPNEYIEPGISFRLEVATKALLGGYATITTTEDHGLAVGQAVQIKNVGAVYDGEFTVTDVPTLNSFRYVRGGLQTSTGTPTLSSVITQRSASGGLATIVTSAAHGYQVGQSVIVSSGYDMDEQGELFNGTFTITQVPTTTTFRYNVASGQTVPLLTLPTPTSTVSGVVRDIARKELTGNVVRLTTSAAHGYSAGGSVTVSGVNHTVPITQKSLNATSSTAQITTALPHQLSTGDSVTINGIRDSSKIVAREITGASATKRVTLTTDTSHNFAVGNVLDIADLQDDYVPTSRSVTTNVATITVSGNHNILVGSVASVSNITDTKTLATVSLANGVATVTATGLTQQVNDVIQITNLSETATVISKEIQNGIAILTTSTRHNFIPGSEITISGINTLFNGVRKVLSVTPTRVFYDPDPEIPVLSVAPTAGGGSITSKSSIFNNSFAVSAAGTNTVSFPLAGNDFTSRAATGEVTPTISGPSVLNGDYTVTAVTATTFSYAKTTVNLGATAIPVPDGEDTPKPKVSQPSRFLGARTVLAATSKTISFDLALAQASGPVPTSGGIISAASVFNGSYSITVTGASTFTYTKTAKSNVFETATSDVAFLTAAGVFNGTYTITTVDPLTQSFTYARTHADIAPTLVVGRGSSVVRPIVTVSTFGPYPGNADIGVGFSTAEYSGINVVPKPFRGFQLTNAGEALDSYSDSIDGFEYRIDCAYDEVTDTFSRTFVLLPINFPDPPAAGEISPLSRFGADKLVFELPGNIINVSLKESAEDSATRFFAIGDTDLGADAGPPFSVASAEDMLNGTLDRRWPLLDEDEQVDIDDETVLYAYAKRYLNESRPPNATISVSVNGSLQPEVGSYRPGDWCSLIVDSDFVRMRLASDLEPRDTVIVRKIDAINVSVPDGSTFPETVVLTLVPEWEVDKRG